MLSEQNHEQDKEIRLMQTKRIGYVDSLKGIAIIFVIIGHLLQYVFYPSTFDDSHLYRYIYSFHMPFFMIISGFTVRVKADYRDKLFKMIGKRFFNLIIPFISWAILKNICFRGPTLLEVIKNPTNGLWFLYALFFIYSIFILTFYATWKLNTIIRYSLFVAVFILLKMIALKVSHFGLPQISNLFIFFFLGHLVSTYKDVIVRKRNLKYLWITVPIFFVLGYFWHRIPMTTTGADLLDVITNSFIYRMTIVVAASFSLFLLFYQFEKNLQKTGLEEIGKITLGIYAVHQIFIKLSFSLPSSAISFLHSNVLGQILMFILVLVLSVMAVFLLNRNKIFAFVSYLFGLCICLWIQL